MRLGSLFSGIGGLDLGLERAGMKTIWMVEKDPWCRKVLAQNFPHVENVYDDIVRVKPDELDEVDVVAGGFPCQDISYNGGGDGLEGDRSGLWWEFHRIVRTVRPLYVVVENVSALVNRGLDDVLGSLAQIGYDAEWNCVQGWWFGSPQRRERIFLVAYPSGLGMERVWPEGFEIPQRLVETWVPIRDSNGQWKVEPDLRRTTDGFSDRVDRLKALGNAVIPQIGEFIGYSIFNAWSKTKDQEMVKRIWRD